MLIVKKWVFAVFTALLLQLLTPCAYAADAPQVSAHSAIVMHSGGEVVFEKNADEHMLIASTTKLMTALVVIERCKLDESVLIEPQHCAVEGSSMCLRPGQRRSVYELLSGLLLASGNDAALALSSHAAGDMESFTVLMNEKAQELELGDTHFANPHGLNAQEHYSTARDMARLMDYCMQNETFYKLTGARSCDIAGQTFMNHNKLLATCPGCIGGKTGYTKLAGRCLVSCCQRGATRYICVTLSAPDDWNDHCALYDWAFSRYTDRDISQGVSFEVPVVSGGKGMARAVPEQLYVFAPSDARLTLSAELPRFVFAPVYEGGEAGRFTVVLNGETVAEGRLLYNEDVAVKE